MSVVKKVLKSITIVIIIIVAIIISINSYVKITTQKQIIQEDDIENLSDIDCIMILGAAIWGDKPSPMLEDRLLEGINLYKNNVSNKIIMSGDHGRKDYAVLILVGQPVLNDILSRAVHEALNQRIIVNYMFIGINYEEVKEYVIDRCNLAEISNEIFDEGSIKALASNCNGSTRYLNNLIEKSLMICCNQKSKL